MVQELERKKSLLRYGNGKENFEAVNKAENYQHVQCLVKGKERQMMI